MGGSETEFQNSEVDLAGREMGNHELTTRRASPAFRAIKVFGVSRASHVKLPRFDGQNDLLGYLEQMVRVFTDDGTRLEALDDTLLGTPAATH